MENNNTNQNQVRELKPLQTKTIAKICKGKIYDWAKSVEKDNPEIAEIIRTKTMITGGALVSLLSGDEVNDFDTYFRDEDSAFRVATYYVEKFKNQNNKWVNTRVSQFNVVKDGDRVKILIKSAGVAAADNQVSEQPNQSVTEYTYFEGTRGDEAETYLQSLISYGAKKEGGYSPIFLSDNAITLTDKIQLVIRFFGEPEEIHKNYDFTACTNIYTSWDNKVTLNMDAMESIRTKTLHYSGSVYPICSILRLRKYIARGWSINAGQILKMIFQIKELNLDDHEVLREQLVSVDSAYFIEMLALMKQAKIDGKTIDQSYIALLIDQIFG